MSMVNKEIDEHLYKLKKHLKDLQAYLDARDFLNAHYMANLVAHEATAISYCKACCNALTDAFNKATAIAHEGKEKNYA